MSALQLSPLMPPAVLAVLAAAVLVLVLVGWYRAGARALAWHLLPAAVLLAALLDPRLTRERATPLDDVAVVVVDDSPSMAVAGRAAQAAAAEAEATRRLKALPGLEVRVVHHANPAGRDEGTRLFATLDQALADVPRRRLAGVVLITDGEVADVPARPDPGVPVHVLVAGHKDERDRRMVIDRAPSFGLVGGTATLVLRVEDPGHDEPVAVTVRKDGGAAQRIVVPANAGYPLPVTIDHAGSNVVEIAAAAVPGELTEANNRTAVAISGVRDRLRVLLISGEPHPGERTWRNLLKADPSVDLVHFTILRPPEKDDRTPLRELALIAFPVKELFEEKLRDFDLIIFDRYRRRTVLPPLYYQNVADFVQRGGALLVAAGSEFARSDSLYDSALAEVLPARPTGAVIERAFSPRVTTIGKRHPVTADLDGADADPPRWGPWVRQIGATPVAGTVVMSGADGQPLLVLDRPGKGRVAELLSDSAWLWGRNWRGGGPQAELLRRLAHWLMKEPDLEEERLSAEAANGRLDIERRSLKPGGARVTVTAPDGTRRPLDLTETAPGRATGRVAADQTGLWRVEDGTHVALAAVGAIQPVEMAALRASADRLAPVVRATGGGLRWLDDGMPDMRKVGTASPVSGSSWFGFRANGERLVTSVEDRPLLPAPLLLVLALGGLALAWWRQGR